MELDIADTSHAVGKPVMELNLPKSAMIVLIRRGGKYVTANGATIIESKDHLLIMADSKKTVKKVLDRFSQPEA